MSKENQTPNPCAHNKNPCGELPKTPIAAAESPGKGLDKQEAIALLSKFKNRLPKATTLVDMKTNNVFAEPGT